MKIENLVRKAKNGDNEAFNNLIVEYQEILYKIAKSRLNSEDDICDVVQNTLISAYKSLNTLKNNKYFKTWLIKILINKCNDFYIKNNQNMIPFEDISNNEEAINKDFTSDYGIDYLIENLNKNEQTILTLYYLEGYSEKEISEIMNINYSTIRTNIRRAKEKIAKNLEKEVI